MKNIIFCFLIFSAFCNLVNAQKELWSVNSGDQYVNPSSYYGNITKYDINGENPVIMHEFDSIHGYAPTGKLFLASNGKLYGTTNKGGIPAPEGAVATPGVLFEYDMIFDQYRVVHYFEFDDNGRVPNIGVIEPVPGQLYGATQYRIYKYDLASGSMIFSNSLPFSTIIYGGLMKASNGNLYGTSAAGNCFGEVPPRPMLGNILKYNITTNHLSFAYSIYCDPSDGAFPNTELIEISPGKLLGTTRGGGIHMGTDPHLRGGTLYEFDTNTNAFTKKVDFNYATTGVFPLNLMKGDNDKIYGLCEAEGAPQLCNPDYNFGTLYEYTPSTNLLEIKQNFNFCNGNTVRYPSTLMRTSNGYFMGTIPGGGLFKYDAIQNRITMPNYTSSNINLYNAANLIEICRKPSYHFFDVNTFDTCAGGTFTYDIQNTNATTYQWLKDGNNVPNQTTGILNLSNLAPSDAGNYTCLMTNECGTTTTMVLHLTVNCLGTATFADLDKSIKLYPNPTKDILNIKLPENITITINNIKIANSLGQIIREQKTQNNPTIDVGQLQNGIYFITLTTNYGNWNGKFVKE